MDIKHILTTFKKIHFCLRKRHRRESRQKQMPEQSRGATQTAAVQVRSNVESELTEVTPCYCAYSTQHIQHAEEQRRKRKRTPIFFSLQ